MQTFSSIGNHVMRLCLDSQSRCVYTAIRIARRYDNKIVVTLELCHRVETLSSVPALFEQPSSHLWLTALSSLKLLPSLQKLELFSTSPAAGVTGSSHPLAARLIAGMNRAAVCRTSNR